MVKIKPLEEISKRYEEAATFIPERYKRAVENVTDWHSKATSDQAEALWKQKIEKAAAVKARQAALKKVTNDEWKAKATDLGYSRIGEGIRKNVDKQKEGFEPYHKALSDLSLPPRSVDPMSNIDSRLKKVVETLVNKKKEILGAK